MEKFLTLPGNQERAEAERTEFASFNGSDSAAALVARKEAASVNGVADFTMVSQAEGRFMDLAIHLNQFLDDAAIRIDVAQDSLIVYKLRYAATVGVTTGSLLGVGTSTMYQTRDTTFALTPFEYNAEGVKVPRLSEVQDVEKLEQRKLGIARQAEAMRLEAEKRLVSVITGQPFGQSVALSMFNYAALANPYSGKTVYVLDPGVSPSSVETSNIVDVRTEAGITPLVLEALVTQSILSDRTVRTIHVPKSGTPWLKLVKYATIVANGSLYGPGVPSNANLASLPPEMVAKIMNTDMSKALNSDTGLVLQIFGQEFKIKANNALPKGVAFVTTDEPAAVVFNIAEGSYDMDVTPDPMSPMFNNHVSGRRMAIGAPDPWVRNWFCLVFDTPSLT